MGALPWQVLWIGLAVIWGSSFLLMKLGLESLHPMQIATLRIGVAAVTLLLLSAAMRTRLPRDARTWALLAVCSCFLTALPFTAFVVAETRISSGLTGLANAFTPVATVLSSHCCCCRATGSRRGSSSRCCWVSSASC
jgi:drug/metabolite transporter (DMT)-like permease